MRETTSRSHRGTAALRQAILGVSVLALAACSSGGSSGVDEAPDGPPGPGAFDPGFATSPEFFTLVDAMKKGLSVSPHGLVRIYYSSNLKDAVTRDSFLAPEGTTAIKIQDRDGDGVVDGIRVMIKKPAGYDDANGDWYYETRDAEGNLVDDPPAGTPSFCVSCHTSFPATDRLAGTSLR